MPKSRCLPALLGLLLLLPGGRLPGAPAPVTLLNVSFDLSRRFYLDANTLFVREWKRQADQDATVLMTHGPGAAEARAVLAGLDADVVTLDEEADLDLLAAHGGAVSPDWRTQFPNEGVPFRSAVMFLVRAGNPKGIKDWDDLARPGVRLALPSPKTSGVGRGAYLAAWAHALRNGGSPAQAREFVRRLFANAAALASGADAASASFTQSALPDALVTFESEAWRIRRDPALEGRAYEPVMPPQSILAPLPVAIVDGNAAKHGARPVAQAYLQFLYSPAAQELAAKSFLRPTDPEVLARHTADFPAFEPVDVQAVFGGWEKAQQAHFADGGIFDQMRLDNSPGPL